MRKLFRLSKAKRQSGVGREQRTNDRYVGLSNRSSQGPHDRSVGVVRDKPRQNDHRSSILRKVSGPSSSSSSFSRKRKHARIFSTIKVKIHQRDWTDAFLNHPSNPPGNGWSPVGGKKPPVRRGDDREEGKREERGKRPSRKRVVKIVKRCCCRRRRDVISLLFLFSLSLSLSLCVCVCSWLSTVEARRGLHRESDRVNGCLTPRTKADEKGARENDDTISYIGKCHFSVTPSTLRACGSLSIAKRFWLREPPSKGKETRRRRRPGKRPPSFERRHASVFRRLSSLSTIEKRVNAHTRQNR